MARRVFYSFHYKPDVSRVAQVRNIGAIEANKPATDNDWEAVTQSGDKAIRDWIADQMKGRSCAVVLVGTNTSKRKWVKYEIKKAWDDGKGVVGIYIHGLKNLDGNIAAKGDNPFDSIPYGTGKKLSSIVKCHNPRGTNSKDRYAWIEENLEDAIEEAIEIRNDN